MKPTVIDLQTVVKQIVGGGKHTIIISDNGIYSCGDNDKGQLGIDGEEKLLMFKKISSQIKITKVSCGWDFNLAVSEDKEIFAWGSKFIWTIRFINFK